MGTIDNLLPTLLSNPDRMILLAPISVCPGACFIALFWEFERTRTRRRDQTAGRSKLSRKEQTACDRKAVNRAPFGRDIR